MPMNPRLLRPRQTGLNPRSIAGLGAWYDASVASSITVSTGVSQWSDLSGLGRHLVQATGNNQPVYTQNEINGRPAVVFDKSNDRLVWSSAGALPQPTTVFCVGKWNAVPSVGNETMFDSATNGNRMRLFGPGALRTAINAGTELAIGSDITLTAYAIHEAIFNGTSSTISYNNSPSLTGNAGTAAADGISLNAFGGFAAFGGVSIAEFVLYSRVLSATQRAAVRRYLASKYRITVA